MAQDGNGFWNRVNGENRVKDEADWADDERIRGLKPMDVPAGAVLFRPGDEAKGFVLVHSGRVAVYLTGKSGREILLYAVEPGETCIQTTLGLLGGQHYTGEAVAETPVAMSLIPRRLFLELMAGSEQFRSFVFKAFADRMADVTRVLEQVAFVKVESRLASLLVERADPGGTVELTHQAIATAIGSAREVVSRRLEALRARGMVSLDRGQIRIEDRPALRALAEEI
ncbi:MAG: Crp/Fnr family transcriptional regulator [Notoacmeibacter sp.]|nr:Crp/Fnr family transcriptional regulator [Notoacmeibacter sp.]